MKKLSLACLLAGALWARSANAFFFWPPQPPPKPAPPHQGPPGTPEPLTVGALAFGAAAIAGAKLRRRK